MGIILRELEDLTVKNTRLEFPYYIKRHTIQARMAMNKISNEGLGPKITEVSLGDFKSSNKVFILGSGDSINQITDDEWNHIDQHDSIGLNRWPVHEFTPTYYVFEHHMHPRREEFNKNHWRMLDHVQTEYENIPIILKDAIAITNRLNTEYIPDWLMGKLIISCDNSFPGVVQWDSSRRKHDKLLSYLDLEGYFDQGKIRTIYRKRSSISYLISLSVILGYENIVLCGVDLNKSPYFFESNNYIEKDIPIPWRPFRKDENKSESEIHETNDPDLGCLTSQEVIDSLNDIILNPRGIDLFVENSSSSLHPNLPVYDQY